MPMILKKKENLGFRPNYDLSTIIFDIDYSLHLIDFLRNSETALCCIQIYEVPFNKLIQNINHWKLLDHVFRF